MSKKKVRILVCFLVAWVYLSAAGTNEAVKTVIRSWQLSAFTQQADTVPVDSSFLHLPMQSMLNNYSISNAWNGNTISPVQSRLYFDRQDKTDDIFATSYAPYIITAQDVRYYNTTTPYSGVGYNRGFGSRKEENEINFFFTGNLNRSLNISTRLNYLNSAGHYRNQQAKLFNGFVATSYNGNHYSLQAAIAFNTLSQFENGGLRDIAQIGNNYASEYLDVNLNAMSGYSFITGYLNHYYSITKERTYTDSVRTRLEDGSWQVHDTVRTQYIPLITFAHTFETNDSRRRYIEHQASQGFYSDTYHNTQLTNDSSNVLTINNTFSVTFEEEYNRLLRFGAMVYLRNETQRHLLIDTLDNEIPLTMGQHWTNNTYVGGSIYKRTGNYIRYNAEGDVCLIGYKLGEFHVNGHIETDFHVGKDSMLIEAHAGIENRRPTYYEQHYHSNHFYWDTYFQASQRYFVGGRWSYPTQWVKLSADADFRDISRPIYYTWSGPQQFDGHVQVLAVGLQLNLTTPWINLDNRAVYQLSGNDSVISLPTLTLYHNLYYHGEWFKKAMQAQIGADLRYHTRYHAPLLNPALGQFCNQQEVLIGNYPILNLYANFFVKHIHLRFFVHYTHVNRLFMRHTTEGQIMPGYPYNPDVLRAGLAWHFNR